ncbi:sodium:solute symporter family protein [Anaerovorax odorimutans]|uniref:Sodium:solute symporter family protein n=1 Tax=Anaerovorax odorimutans TaxID=109327 RepID=A0ABT1RRA7_9FIRM|nr:sodium:solute symporter family protein [Anaerovorax odorimutans]MCQ4637732.1 sodium:solute symporter family protein [Anaerovorax odorimutans]
MPVNSVVMLIICIFAFIPLLLAEIARNRSLPTISDFFLQGRGLKIFPMYATVFATWMSAFAFMGAISYFYEQGPIYMTTIGWDALFAALFYGVGRRIWFYGKCRGYVTPADFFSDIYGSKALSLTVTGIAVVFTMIYIQVQMVGGLFLIQIATEGYISWQVSGLIFFAILVIYLWAGGLRAVALTDMFYGALIIITILGCGLFLMKTAGGMEKMFAAVVADDVSHVTLGGEEGSARIGLWLSLFVVVPVGAFMGPQMWIRNFSSGSVKNFDLLPLLLCLSSIICIGTLFAGSASILLNEGGKAGDTLIASLMLRYAPPLLCAFVFIGIAAAILSTANSQIHALAAIYTMDIHKKYINRKITERRLLSVAKWSVLLISIAAYILILVIPQSVFQLGVIALGGMMQLIVPVLGALFWPRSTSKGALAGLWGGILVFFLTAALTDIDTSGCALFGLVVNGMLFVIFSLLHRGGNAAGEKIQAYRISFYNHLK